MEKLTEELERLWKSLPGDGEMAARLETLVSVYPFNEYEYMISGLLGADLLSFDEYLRLRDEYIARNMYLHLFEISAPRGFGELWAQGHLKELVPELVKPTKKLDAAYNGQYDFLLDGHIQIEVKASRAVRFQTNEPLYVKALASTSLEPFDMNFQQIKPSCCHVFVWVAAWRDVIRYWVLSSAEVESSPYYSGGQHRGNVGEGQLHLTKENIEAFSKFETAPRDLAEAIRNAQGRVMAPSN